MDLTQGTVAEKTARAKKTMMWFAMASMVMTFAGLTSAYVVSKNRKDWLSDLEFPVAFVVSVLVIVASSITLFLVKKAILNNNRKLATSLLIVTLALSILFIFLQFRGFDQIISQGYFFTGSESTVMTSFIYAIVVTHLAHVIGGVIVLLVLIYNHFKQRYKTGQTLGLELGAMYWHFVDFLWVYLFLFLYFVR
ncbi:heme-copper oxidase subunit III [Aquimarina hainanensis]|uniref:Heme-copper oxidase subunit III n=1 Tax=Aquimarina hainanensis TaxID=1578017 RepID=A0ABW5N539_9FLAO|nr:cytochrome c oxidase subunit 3 [Aquimarina sp. TRL1]QKX05160.1 heme-copper oxidase subunit III [Aquimarina sp. TRL1]